MQTLADSRPGEMLQVARVSADHGLRRWFEQIGLRAGRAVRTNRTVQVFTETQPEAGPRPIGQYIQVQVGGHTVMLERSEAQQVEVEPPE